MQSFLLCSEALENKWGERKHAYSHTTGKKKNGWANSLICLNDLKGYVYVCQWGEQIVDIVQIWSYPPTFKIAIFLKTHETHTVSHEIHLISLFVLTHSNPPFLSPWSPNLSLLFLSILSFPNFLSTLSLYYFLSSASLFLFFLLYYWFLGFHLLPY